MKQQMSELDKVVAAVIETVLNAVEIQRPGIVVDGEALLSGQDYEDVEIDVARDISAYARGGVNQRLRERNEDLANRLNQATARYYLLHRRVS